MADSSTTRRRGRPVRAGRDDIVATSSRMLASGGAGAFSMRRLADELGVSTAAVYHHFPTKTRLFIAVLGARADELERPELPADPRDRLVALSVHLLAALRRFPWVVDILLSGEAFGRAALWILDEFIATATRLGADDEYAGYMYITVWRYLVGCIVSEHADDERRAAAAGEDPPPHWTAEIDAEDLADLPAIQRVLPIWPAVHGGYQPQAAIEHLVDGLLARIRR
ncbi:TetR/AcrR family transcriptional regulator [Nocardia mexicana]|nr:TetR/AcrR family transcriptional regulator [Nocardia mexicana]